MKLAIDARGAFLYHGTGIGTYTDNLISEMINQDSKDEFTLFCSAKFNSDYSKDNTHIIFSSGRHGTFYEKYYFPHKLRKDNIDLYHIPQNGIGYEFNSEISTVVTIHDLIPYIMPETVGTGYLQRFLRDMPNIIYNCSGILTVSEYSKRDILKFFSFYPEDKIFVTPLAANSNFKPLDKKFCKSYVQKNYNIDTPYILYLGGFSSRKNAFGLIKSFEKIYTSLNKPCTLILGGSLKDEGLKLQDYVNKRNLQDKIIFCGYVEDDILPVLYSGCEAFIYPSLYEGFGLPPLEAMSCRAPVITSNISSIPEVTGDSAILVNPFNDDELASSMEHLLNDESLKTKYGERGYKRSLEFSWNKTAQNTLKAYDSIVSSIIE